VARPKRWRWKAATNLDHFYDGLVSGEPAPQGEIDPELASIAMRLNRTGRRSAAPHAFKQQLWEDLMQSSGTVPAQSGFTGLRPPLSQPIDHQPADQSSPAWRGVPRSVLLQAAVAALLVLGVLSAFRPGFDQGDAPELSLNAPLLGSPAASPWAAAHDEATPQVVTGELALPEDCTTHVLRLNEIAAILDAASRDVTYEGGQQRPTGREYLILQTTMVTFSGDATVDQAIVGEIQPVYDMYFACASAGSVRQKLYLMTPSGIARRLINPNGRPVWLGIAQLGVPPTPVPGNLYIPEITATQELQDGRIAVRYQYRYEDGNMSGPSTMIFRNIDGTWYIDEIQCGTCG
jgi:hypothetical protein